jgi:hypothetical protein
LLRSGSEPSLNDRLDLQPTFVEILVFFSHDALLLGDGHAPRQIANIVGVTENTVRSQIKSIFSKTGVRRQSDLVRLLLSNAQPTIQACE